MPCSLVAGNDYIEDDHPDWKSNDWITSPLNQDYMDYTELYKKLLSNKVITGRVTNTMDDHG